MKLGRVALKSGRAYITVNRKGRTSLEATRPGPKQSFQWIETPTGELVLMSLASNRYLTIDPRTQVITADSPGPESDGSDGTRFVWSLGLCPKSLLVVAEPLSKIQNIVLRADFFGEASLR